MRALTVALIAVIATLATAGGAAAGPTVTNISLAGQSSVEPGSPTCAGGTATNTFTFRTGHLHQTIQPDGTEHDTLTVEGSFLQVPDDPNQPTYTGHFTFWDGDNFNKNVQISPNSTTSIHATGTDGSVIHIHWTFMLQIKNGEAHIANSTFSCH